MRQRPACGALSFVESLLFLESLLFVESLLFLESLLAYMRTEWMAARRAAEWY